MKEQLGYRHCFLNVLQSYTVVKQIDWIDLNNFNLVEVCTV